MEEIIKTIKDEILKNDHSQNVLGIFTYGHFSVESIDESKNDPLEVLIITLNDKFNDNIINILSNINKNNPIHPNIWSFDELQKSGDETIKSIFKEGKLIYWNASMDVLASQVFRIKPYTIFSFSLPDLEQNKKVQFNYQLYGKKDTGMLKKLDGIRITKSCFYIPYSNRYKILRFFDKFKIQYKTLECWI